MWKTRLRGDFHLAIIVMFGAITALGITPFAIYRFLNGQPMVALVDMVIVIGIVASSAYAWRTGRTAGAALIASVTYSIGCVAVAHLAGLSGLFWVYPVLVANFLLVGRWPALVISTFAIAAIITTDAALVSALQKVMFGVTAAVVSLFSFVFASRAELQRSQLEAIALRDPLTGAGNRRGLEAELEIAMASSARSGTPLGLVVFDLDFFKLVNDDFGHEAGDEVLVRVSELVRASTRKDDRFFRLGGEEFGLLCPGANPDALWNIAEKLRICVEREVQCRGRGITISLGAAILRPGESAGDWLARADAAMYRAKRSGRNRTVIEDRSDSGAVAPAAVSAAPSQAEG